MKPQRALASGDQDPKPKLSPVDMLIASAKLSAQRQADKLLGEAQQEALRLKRAGWENDEIEDALKIHLGELADSEITRIAATKVNEAFSLGRVAAASEWKDKIQTAVYSAILDNNVCHECEKLDGEEYDIDSDEYEAHMPPNVDCEGGDQCRCTYLYILKEEGDGNEQADEVDAREQVAWDDEYFLALSDLRPKPRVPVVHGTEPVATIHETTLARVLRLTDVRIPVQLAVLAPAAAKEQRAAQRRLGRREPTVVALGDTLQVNTWSTAFEDAMRGDAVAMAQVAAELVRLYEGQPRQSDGRFDVGKETPDGLPTNAAINKSAGPDEAKVAELLARPDTPAAAHLAAATVDELLHPPALLGASTLDRNEIATYLKTHGQEWTAAKRPADVERGKAGQCYRNATGLVMDNHLHGDGTLEYAEGIGYVSSIGKDIGFMHSWAVTPDGHVIDPTWEHTETARYVGVKYPWADYQRHFLNTGTYGVLGGGPKAAKAVLHDGRLRTAKEWKASRGKKTTSSEATGHA